jgi:hypothetical protein
MKINCFEKIDFWWLSNGGFTIRAEHGKAATHA